MTPASPVWLRRLAWITCAATLFLIAVGGLVTSTDSGMAFPDWPTSAGHNLFAYPWLRSAGAKFIEHGHRLTGSLVGCLTLALAFGLWARDERRWMKELGLLAAAAVLLQGVMGGMRVLNDSRVLAFLHACLAQAFFALTVVIAVLVSPSDPAPEERGLARASVLTALLAYVQIVVGAAVRQLHRGLQVHIVLAVLVTVALCALAYRVLRDHADRPFLARPAMLLAGLVLFQASLGIASYVSKLLPPGRMPAAAVTHTTAHVVGGALVLGAATALALRLRRPA